MENETNQNFVIKIGYPFTVEPKKFTGIHDTAICYFVLYFIKKIALPFNAYP